MGFLGFGFLGLGFIGLGVLGLDLLGLGFLGLGFLGLGFLGLGFLGLGVLSLGLLGSGSVGQLTFVSIYAGSAALPLHGQLLFQYCSMIIQDSVYNFFTSVCRKKDFTSVCQIHSSKSSST